MFRSVCTLPDPHLTSDVVNDAVGQHIFLTVDTAGFPMLVATTECILSLSVLHKKHACLLRQLFSQSQEHCSNFVSSGMPTWSRRPAEAQNDYQFYLGKNSVLSEVAAYVGGRQPELRWSSMYSRYSGKTQRTLSISNCSFHWRSQTLLINLSGLQWPASLLDHRP